MSEDQKLSMQRYIDMFVKGSMVVMGWLAVTTFMGVREEMHDLKNDIHHLSKDIVHLKGQIIKLETKMEDQEKFENKKN